MNPFRLIFVLFFLLFIGSATALILILLPLFTSEARYQLDRIKFGKGALRSWIMPQFQVTIPEPQMDKSFSLWIEKIKAQSMVYINTDASDSRQYKPVLMQGVAHARGTALPGEGKGNIYLFAHSTDTTLNIVSYNAVFFLLRKLEKGDDIVIYYQGKRYVYQIFDKFITEAADTRYLTRGSGPETLVLQTCWPPGTTWKRLLVLASPK